MSQPQNTHVLYFTVEQNPIPYKPIDDAGGWDIAFPKMQIVDVQVATKKGIEIQVGSNAMADPSAECWFAVFLRYDSQKPNGKPDTDVLITNGDEFWLCRRDLGKTPFVLNDHQRERIRHKIQQFVKGL